MNDVKKLFLFLINMWYIQLGYAQQIKTFFNNAYTFYYEKKSPPIQKPLVNTVSYVAFSVKGCKPQQEVLLLPNGRLWYNGSNDVSFCDNVVKFKQNDNVYCGVFDGHGIEHDSTENKKIDRNWGLRAATCVVSRFCYYLGQNPNQNMSTLFNKVVFTKTLEEDFANNGGTTACVCKIERNTSACVYNVGDSRAVSGFFTTEHTLDHDFNHTKDGPKIKEIQDRVKKLEQNGSDSIMSDQIVIEIPKTSNKLIFMGSDGCFDFTRSASISEICYKLYDNERSLDVIAIAIVMYINLAEKSNNTREIDYDIDKSNVKKVIELFNNTNLYNAIEILFNKDNDFSKWHDNASFILLNDGSNILETKSTWHFRPVNKEGAILLFLLLMGMCGKYLIAYK